MDSLDWSNEFEESLIMSGSNGAVLFNGNKINEATSLKETCMNPAQPIQKTGLFVPNFFPQWNSRYRAGSGWGVAVNAGTTTSSRSFNEYSRPTSSSSPLDTNIPPLQNSINHINHDSSCVSKNPNILDHHLQQLQQMKPRIATTTTTTSFESSLDCLLQSASTSLTDTTTTSADQDDGISLIFSDCRKNLWNFTKPAAIGKNNSEDLETVINQPRSSNKRRREAIISEPSSLKQRINNLDFQSPDRDRGFQLISENQQKSKKPRLDKQPASSTNINFKQSSSTTASSADEPDAEAIAQMKEIIYRAAAFRPVDFGVEAGERPKRKNVRISKDPQTVAARQRRERISERIRVLQTLVPGGSKMDTASMLDEAANYLKFLRSQVKALEAIGLQKNIDPTVHNFPANANLAFSPFLNYSFAAMHQHHQPQFSIHNPNQSKS